MLYDLTGGSDYASGPYSVVIPAGQTHAHFDVSIMDDVTVENNENFLLIINSNSLPDKISAKSPDRPIITILDNDG